MGALRTSSFTSCPATRCPDSDEPGTADLSTLEEKADTPGEEFLDFVNSSLCYVKTGRRPYGISVYAGTRFEKEYEAVLPYFDLAVDARSSKDCKDLCLKVLKSNCRLLCRTSQG